MFAMAFFLTLLAAVNLAVAYLWLCQRALEKSLSPTRTIWPAIVPVRRPVAKAEPARAMYDGGVLDPIEMPATAPAVMAMTEPAPVAPAVKPKAAPRARKPKA